MILEIGDYIKERDMIRNWGAGVNFHQILSIDDSTGIIKAKNFFANCIFEFNINDVILMPHLKVINSGCFII